MDAFRAFEFGFIAIFKHPVGIITGWLYYSLFESSSFRATIGKIVLKIQVVQYDGAQISFVRASGRFFGKYLSGLSLGVGFLWIFFNHRRQALHDIMAGAIVVKRVIHYAQQAANPQQNQQ